MSANFISFLKWLISFLGTFCIVAMIIREKGVSINGVESWGGGGGKDDIPPMTASTEK